MSKVIAGWAIHYGVEYLAYSVRGLMDVADEIHMFYSAKPSYGHSEGATCPDTEEQLFTEAKRFLPANKPFFWHPVVNSPHEGYHKDLIVRQGERSGADIVFVMDADEVWAPAAAQAAVDYVLQNNARRWQVNFEHFWRSWKYVVRDHFKSYRIVDLRGNKGDACVPLEVQGETLYHFGYAQGRKTMEYKFTCHGHAAEFKSTWRAWLSNKFYGWKLGDVDCHPSIKDFWIPMVTPPEVLARVETHLHDHPYRGLDLIE